MLRASNSIITWSSNFTWIEATNATNFTYQWAGILATNNTNFTLFASNALYGLLPAPGSFFPWQDGSQNVLITNEFGIPRIRAQQNGGMIGGVLDMLESDGATEFFYNDASGDTFLMDRNYGGANRRLEIDDQASGSSNAYLRGGLGANLAYNGPNIGSGPPTGAGIAIGGGQGTLFAGRPLVFQNVTGTTTSSGAVAIGTLTNFASVQVTSDTIYNTFSLQGDCMTNNGDAVIRDIGMTFATGSSYSVDMEFNGQVIFATGSFNSISGAMSLRCGVTTDASGNFHYNCMATGSGLSTANTFASVGHHSWNTATATNFYINVIAYVGSDDITVESDNTKLAPGAKWNSLP